ncbi:MAG: hypothetical protein M1817_002865 [Caeruleum heppii]|nr:MAG: hypothetical protein M1817_002865 [Caeruleum heppii]
MFLSLAPFLLTFLVVGTAVLRKLFPFLSGEPQDQSSAGASKPSSSWRSSSAQAASSKRPLAKQIAAFDFSATIALATVLAELLLCEISNTLNAAARTLALRVTVSALLVLLIIVTPLLEIHSVISAAGWSFTNDGSRGFIRKLAWGLEFVGFAGWIITFWWVGQSLPGTHRHDEGLISHGSLREACLERVGIIGICLMALLSGFASVSSVWQNFGVKHRPVTEADIARKQAGLDATIDMLAAKESRLRALEKKMANAPPEGFMSKMIGSIRGDNDLQERKSLQLEVNGLETMRLSLSNSLSTLQDRHRNLERSATHSGKLLVTASYTFSVYCLYRICATSIATLRRWWYPDTTFAGTDPINNFLALVAKHLDPTLDRHAWSQQISFLLSGIILLASFNAVLQTFRFFSRFTPALLYHAQANLALLVGQVSATYVISSALLLRSNLPREVGSVISEALGAPLDSAFVDRWFEGWFLMASGLTAVGIFLGRKLGGAGEWDDEADVEMGEKRS